MGKPPIDYSLYLVTGRELLPPGKDYYESLEESLRGGVTVVQVREKTADTGEFIEIATRTRDICARYGVPVLINDRIDVHLAVGTAGVHVGQTDCPLGVARRLLGPDAVLGASVSSAEEGRRAAEEGADYVGVGPVWATKSKDVSAKRLQGPEGVGQVLDELAGTGVQSVAIGGIHLPNLPHLLHASVSPRHRKALDGVAVISDIVGSTQPQQAAEALGSVVDSFKRARLQQPASVFPTASESGGPSRIRTREGILHEVGRLMDVVRRKTPMIHQMTNNVVINDSANATLAVGASPIMATHPRDAADLSSAIAALLINFGTITDKEGMLVAGRQANVNRKPLVFDPVAVGATSYRRETSKELLQHWQPTVIKGNQAEIGALSDSSEVTSRGVDSGTGGFKDPGAVVKALARKRATIVVMTGETDWISDGEIVVKANNGHPLLGNITGSGCMTGTLVATFCAAARLAYLADHEAYEPASSLVQGDMLLGAIAGVLVFTVAAEVAAARPDVKGPGTFRAALLDELYLLKPEALLRMAKIEID